MKRTKLVGPYERVARLEKAFGDSINHLRFMPYLQLHEFEALKRIRDLCPGYQKIADGVLILEELTLPVIRRECPHFSAWLTKLEGLSELI